MMRNIVVVSACGLGVAAIASVVGLLSLSTQSAPRIELPAHSLYLGKGRSGEILDGTFQVRNRGGAPLTYEATPSCGCSDLQPRSGVIPPYELTNIRVGIKLPYEGSHKTVDINFQTDDPVHPNSKYVVYAECPEIIKIKPSHVDLGAINGKQASVVPVKVVMATSTDGKDKLQNIDLNKVVLTANSNLIKISDVDSDTDSFRFSVSLKDDVPLGRIQSTIDVKIQDDDYVAKIPVSADVFGSYRVLPSVLVIPKSKSNNSNRSTVLMVRGVGVADIGPLENATVPEGLLIDETDCASEHWRCFRVSINSEALDWSTADIKLKFRDLNDMVSVQILNLQ